MADITIKDFIAEFEGPPEFLSNAVSAPSISPLGGLSGPSSIPNLPKGASVGLSFGGINQYNLRNLLGGSFVPPDTMGAVGATQFMETSNGVYAIYNKSNGALLSMMRADNFWAAAGGTAGNLSGDARVLFDQPSQRWIVAAFDTNPGNIAIAVSDTANAAGTWKFASFTGYTGVSGFGGIADYPTLAIDKSAIYIGTNNFSCNDGSCSAADFKGTTLNILPRADIFGAGAPTTARLKQLSTCCADDHGWSVQAVNSKTKAGLMISDSAAVYDKIRYNVNNPGTAGATLGPVTYLNLDPQIEANHARQPDGTRNIDALDTRISANAWEQNGKIYAVTTVTTPGGNDHAEVRVFVTDANTNAVIQQIAIADPNFDYFEGSIAVNASGQVVVGYNRSGLQTTDLNGDGLADGNVSFMARSFNTNGAGQLVQTDEILLHVSPVSDYHNGSGQGAAASDRQRWGDYSAVTLDPSNSQSFWAIGEYAEIWNNAAGCGAVGGIAGCTQTGGSTWGTWISEISLAPVPEPQSFAMMLAGLLALGGLVRQRAANG